MQDRRQEHEQRENLDRRGDDRRRQAIPVEVEKREEERRSDTDRRETSHSPVEDPDES